MSRHSHLQEDGHQDRRHLQVLIWAGASARARKEMCARVGMSLGFNCKPHRGLLNRKVQRFSLVNLRLYLPSIFSLLPLLFMIPAANPMLSRST